MNPSAETQGNSNGHDLYPSSAAGGHGNQVISSNGVMGMGLSDTASRVSKIPRLLSFEFSISNLGVINTINYSIWFTYDTKL